VARTIVDVVSRLDRGTSKLGCTVPAVVMRGFVRTAAHLDPSWIGTDARALVEGATGRRCIVINDADAAGVAEIRFGAGRDCDGVVVMVTLGTGVGTALFTGGRLVPNSELGHIEVRGKSADLWVSDRTREKEKLDWKQWSKRLNTYLKAMHALLWPEVIVLGGGVVKRSDEFLHRLDPGCEVRIAQLGNNAGIVGAALVAADATFTASEV
jgi:polyphosphate glucokinase